MSRVHQIGVIPGDGTGPEVVAEALKVLGAAGQSFGFKLETTTFDLGGARYLKDGTLLPDEVLDQMSALPAVLLGAVGHPEMPPGLVEREVLLRMRFELDLYVNLRPVKLLPGVQGPLRDKSPEQIDLIIVRENSEGPYSGAGGYLGKGKPREVALEESINTRAGVERILRYAFELTGQRQRGQLTLCHKSNVLVHAGDLWLRAFKDIGADYPDIPRNYSHADAVCLWLISEPERFDVIVTDNLFGDIISEVGAAVAGGLGVAPGANLRPGGLGVFEPIGGTAPDEVGKGTINPLAAILAGGMLLGHLGEQAAAQALEEAVGRVAPRMESMAAGQMGWTTTQVGDMVAEALSAG